MAINASRAERRTDEYLKLSTSTSDIVAPGSYEPKLGKEVGEAVAPFMSLQDKELNPLSLMAKMTPGPGSYAGQEPPDGGALPGAGLLQMSFKSKLKRLAASTPGSTVYTESTIAKNPGPGTYGRKGSMTPPPMLDLMPAVKPVLKDRDKTAPSVPPMRYLPGQVPQTEAASADVAKLTSRHTGEPRDMAGPGEYDIVGERKLAKNDRITVFHDPGKRKFRQLWEPTVAIDCAAAPTDLPGPGAYDGTTTAKPGNHAGAVTQFVSKSPMAQDVEVKDKQRTPGPGAYTIVAKIDKSLSEQQERMEAVGNSAGFGSMTERVGWSRDLNQPFKDPYHLKHVPGPGHYTMSPGDWKDPNEIDPNKVLQRPRRSLHGVHHPTLILALQETEGPLQAFNTSDDRPCNKEFGQLTPAPWQYLPETARGTSMVADLKEKAKIGRKGVFGSCADRFFRSPLNAREGLPDPSYDGGKINMGKDPSSPEARSPFQSGSPRMQAAGDAKEVGVIRLGELQTPAPGEYEIKEPNYRSPYRMPRSEHLSFGSGTARFHEKQEVFAKFKLPEGPSPGDYNTLPSKRHVVGGARLKDKRKPATVGCTTTTVGPGSYGDQIDTALLKKTYNVTTQARSILNRNAPTPAEPS